MLIKDKLIIPSSNDIQKNYSKHQKSHINSVNHTIYEEDDEVKDS